MTPDDSRYRPADLLSTWARALGGEVQGGNVLCPGPGHSEKDRSLSVKPESGARDGFIVHSFAGDDVARCRDHVSKRLGKRSYRPPSSLSLRVVVDQAKISTHFRVATARRIWREGLDARCSMVEDYLSSRRLRLDEELATSLRFHPRLPLDGLPQRAMIALMRDVLTDEPCGLHRTWLNSSGRKIARRMLGRARHAAIKLDADPSITTSLTIGEGIETGIAARQLNCGPVWALGSAVAIQAFPVIPGIETLRILAEHDESGANARAVEVAAERWLSAGRDVFVLEPKLGDMNDAVMGGTAWKSPSP